MTPEREQQIVLCNRKLIEDLAMAHALLLDIAISDALMGQDLLDRALALLPEHLRPR